MYSPKPYIGTDLLQYVQDELQAISRSQQETQALELRTVHSEPKKPREGMIVTADGVDWDPGSGGGAYVYFGGVWVFLGLQSTPLDLSIYMQKANNLSDVANITTARNNLLTGVPCFSVHKNGTNQTGVANSTTTQVTWPTEIYDIGSFFASNVWTPPAGRVALKFGFIADGTILAGSAVAASITKNGATTVFKSAVGTSITNAAWAYIDIEDVANGTDAYGAAVTFAVTGTATIRGVADQTWFMGHWISP